MLVLFFLIVVVQFTIVMPWCFENLIGYKDIIDTYDVTDKWTKQVGGLFCGSSTHYYLELDNSKEKEVNSFEWHQYDVGDKYVIEYRVLDLHQENMQ